MTRPKTRNDVLSPATIACLDRIAAATRRPLARQKRGHLDRLLAQFKSAVTLKPGSAERDCIDRIAALKPLSIEQDILNAAEWLLEGDLEARQALLLSHIPRIFRILIKESTFGEDWMDVLNDAICDAIAAVDNMEVYDYKSFSTNVGLSVVHRRTFRALNFHRAVAGPRSQGVRSLSARILSFDLDAFREGEVSNVDIDRLGRDPLPRDNFERMRTFFSQVDTSEFPDDGDAGELDLVEAKIDAEKIQNMLERALDNRARDIIVRRYMSDDREEASSIAEDWSITPERVRQIERQSLLDLKAYLENRKTDKQIREEKRKARAERERQQLLSRRQPKVRTVKGVDLAKMRPQMKATLSEDKIEVICRRYFAAETPPRATLVARDMGISPRKVRRLEAAALSTLASLQEAVSH